MASSTFDALLFMALPSRCSTVWWHNIFYLSAWLDHAGVDYDQLVAALPRLVNSGLVRTRDGNFFLNAEGQRRQAAISAGGASMMAQWAAATAMLEARTPSATSKLKLPTRRQFDVALARYTARQHPAGRDR